jgi:hypothetical protein
MGHEEEGKERGGWEEEFTVPERSLKVLDPGPGNTRNRRGCSTLQSAIKCTACDLYE